MIKKVSGGIAAVALIAGIAPALAQNGGLDRNGGSGVSYGDAIGAAVLSDVSRDRQREREARRTPYATPGHGSITTQRQARDACSARALGQVGGRSKLAAPAYAHSMATGWEVEGDINVAGGGQAHFVCSVRNGSVTGLLVK